jgi:hypothetical protein
MKTLWCKNQEKSEQKNVSRLGTFKRDVPVWCVEIPNFLPILRGSEICAINENSMFNGKRTLIASVRKHNIHHLAEPFFCCCSATNRGRVSYVLCTVHYLQITFLVLNFTKRTFFQNLKGNIDSPLPM